MRASLPLNPDDVGDGYATMLSEELSAAPEQRMRIALSAAGTCPRPSVCYSANLQNGKVAHRWLLAAR
jgi:hypothetical protein